MQVPRSPSPGGAFCPRVVPLLVIGGPTATGKTGLAVGVARATGGEIISADSMQIYRHLDVGTAKPTPQERASARFHLVDCVEPDQPYSVADFQRDAQRAILEVYGRGALPILCGGTGLYLRAVLQHFQFPGAEPPDRRQVRAEVERALAREGSGALHCRLRAVDPQAAARISPGDARRIVRALEVYHLGGEPISARQRVDENPALQYNAAYIVLSRPRQTLYRAIEARVDAMVAAGWLEEVRRLRDRGFPAGLQSLQAIGYRHFMQWLDEGNDGENLADVVETIKRDTRRFAKRQLTWFRRDPARWLQWADAGELEAVEQVVCRQAWGLRQASGLSAHCGAGRKRQGE